MRIKKEEKIMLGLMGIGMITSLWLIVSQSARLDETQSMWISSKSVVKLMELTAKDVHVPLYALLLHLVMKFGGVNIIWARLLSFAFWVATAPFLYRLAREAGNKAVAMLTTVLFYLSPFVIWYSGEARMYSLFALVVTANLMFYLRLIRSGGQEARWGYFITAVLGLFTHYFFGLIAACEVLYVLGRHFRKRNKKGTEVVFGGLLMSALFLLLPWLAEMKRLGEAQGMGPVLKAPTSFNILSASINFIFGFQTDATQAILVSLWPTAVVFIFLVFTQGRRHRGKNTQFFILTILLPTIVLFFTSVIIRPAFLPRYLIMITPLIFYLIAWGVVSLPSKMAGLVAGVLVAAMSGMALMQTVSADTPVKEAFRETADYLMAEAKGNEIVAVSAPFILYPMEYTYLGKARLVSIPEWNRFREAMPEFEEEEMKKQSAFFKQNYQNMYLVLAFDQGYEEKIRFYYDNNFEMLSRKRFGANIEVTKYKLKYE